jgi:hypothetical protein
MTVLSYGTIKSLTVLANTDNDAYRENKPEVDNSTEHALLLVAERMGRQRFTSLLGMARGNIQL